MTASRWSPRNGARKCSEYDACFPHGQGISDSGFPINGVQVPGSVAVVFNVSRGQLNDPRVREAFALATNRKDFLAKTSLGFKPYIATSWYDKRLPRYASSQEVPAFDLKKAQGLIDQYVAEKGGPVKFSILAM